jgi:hypothetical protein
MFTTTPGRRIFSRAGCVSIVMDKPFEPSETDLADTAHGFASSSPFRPATRSGSASSALVSRRMSDRMSASRLALA